MPAFVMAARQQVEAAIEICRFVQHNHHGRQVRIGDPVEMPSAEILVPRPGGALNSRFNVNLAVVQVNCFIIKKLLCDTQRPR